MATSADQSKTNVTGANGALALEQGKDVQTLLPHLESLERIIKLPVVNAALDKSQDVYQNVKGRNRVFNWALNAAEDCVSRAVVTAAPIVSKLDRPIQYVDQTLVKGIDKLEVTAPIIKETPQEMYNQAKSKVVEVVQPHFERVSKLKSAGQQKAASLKDLAWAKANEVLATHYGSIAVSGVDATTALAERLLEYYFPRSDDDSEDYSVDQQDVELDVRFLVAASTVFLSMSFRIISELIDYVSRNPDIINLVNREINNFLYQFPPTRTLYYTQSRPLADSRIRSRVVSIETFPDRSSVCNKET
ncbi:lipid storage droplets surface-binding protein 2 isoform X5 [Eurosta solidaginis]|uniref:lipid storage droplets surface-binding protein 2 isoform X5 n=1 Tax=Eurosta solidaginis TaxID=178769 RepID=UPI00353080B1